MGKRTGRAQSTEARSGAGGELTEVLAAMVAGMAETRASLLEWVRQVMGCWLAEVTADETLFEVETESMHGDLNMFEIFLSRDALLINQARQRHLAALGLDLAGKRVLEVGAGVGLHTQFFEALGCSVLTTDGRPENVAEIRRRYPHRRAQVLDLDNADDLSYLGTFDIIYCYGTLYHLATPETALKAMAQICEELILLETCVSRGDEVAVNPLAEPAESFNQASSETGCRPTRPWVMTMLDRYFGHAYLAKFQPCHPDFDLDWNDPSTKLLHRSIFVGSKAELTNAKLSSQLLDRQTHDPDLGQPVWIDVGAHLGETTFQLQGFGFVLIITNSESGNYCGTLGKPHSPNGTKMGSLFWRTVGAHCLTP